MVYSGHMQSALLHKVRLTQYFVLFLILFLIFEYIAPHVVFTSGALTLFSVNSFLYGFYIAPILSAQKARIEDLHKIVRSEANAVFAMVIGLKRLPAELRNQLQDLFILYLQKNVHNQKAGAGEREYESLITFCLTYSGEYQADIDKLLDKLVANQLNRTNFAMQMSNKVFSNEWMVMLVLFSITLSFVLLLDAGKNITYHLLAALLATGLSMLLIILLKMSTLTHKKARQMWEPYKKLIASHFYRID